MTFVSCFLTHYLHCFYCTSLISSEVLGCSEAYFPILPGTSLDSFFCCIHLFFDVCLYLICSILAFILNEFLCFRSSSVKILSARSYLDAIYRCIDDSCCLHMWCFSSGFGEPFDVLLQWFFVSLIYEVKIARSEVLGLVPLKVVLYSLLKLFP
jgi:hypothetical protein